MSGPATYTRRTLAEACGLSRSQLDWHTRRNTLRLQDAKHTIPGVGIQFHAGRAAKFIAAMQAKHASKLSTHHAI